MNENGIFVSGDFDGKFLGESGISDNFVKWEEIVLIIVVRVLECGWKIVWELVVCWVVVFFLNDVVFLMSFE